MNKPSILFLAGMLCLLVSSSLWAGEPVEMSIEPESIRIGTFYTGMKLAVSGNIPEACDAIAVLSGEQGELHLKEKGKALGLLWMNMGSLTYHEVPAVFFVSSRNNIDNMAGSDDDDRLNAKNIGLAGLRKKITVDSEKNDPRMYIDELFKLKQQEGLYQEQTGSISYTDPVQGKKNFRMNINLPSRLSPGNYTVNVYAVKDGKISGNAAKQVKAELAGVPAFLATLAFGHSLLYGILATLIAIASGLAIGFIFQGAKGGAH